MITKNKFEEIYNKTFSEEIIESVVFEKILKNTELLDSDFSLFSGITKIIHSSLQSLDIKLGYFLENLLNEIIYSKQGVTELSRIYKNSDNKNMDIDSHFLYEESEYIIEIKKRDNHDSTKWHGQISNLIEKYNSSKNTNKKPIIYFIDASYGKKNYKKYFEKWHNDINNDDLKIYYGKELFDEVDFLSAEDWDQFIEYVLIASKRIEKKINYFLMNIENDRERLNEFIKTAFQYIDSKSFSKEKNRENKKRINDVLLKYVK